MLASSVGLGALVDIEAAGFRSFNDFLDISVEALALEPGLALRVKAPTIGSAPVRIFSALFDGARLGDV